MIRVLVVDASAEIRRILTAYLSSDPSIKVVGVATNLSSAQCQIERLRPDIVTLHEDLHDEALLKMVPPSASLLGKVPLLILGNIDEATRLVLSEPNPSLRDRSTPKRRRAIVCKTPQDQRFTEICKRIHQMIDQSPTCQPQDESSPIARPESRIGIIGIAVSTGGPNALLHILSQVSSELSVPVVVTQHMPGQFTPLLVDRLRSQSSLPVYEANDSQLVQPGSVYLAPGDRHLTVSTHDEGVAILLSDGPKENSCRPSADVMFRSIADVFGERSLGIVLTGMGVDGQNGCRYLKSRGGVVIAQDEGSSTVWGMPKAVIHAGLADEVVPLGEIPQLLNQRYSKRSRDT
jgi:two-component system chemotaxis response regulator CheB